MERALAVMAPAITVSEGTQAELLPGWLTDDASALEADVMNIFQLLHIYFS